MSYKYEMVGNRRELWDSLSFKDWALNPISWIDLRYWCMNEQKNIYVISVGSFRDDPVYFYDMSFENHIIRMDVDEHINEEQATETHLQFIVNNIYIPKSVWNKKEEIIDAIFSAFQVIGNARRNVSSVEVSIVCEPTCVEVDYNGR